MVDGDGEEERGDGRGRKGKEKKGKERENTITYFFRSAPKSRNHFPFHSQRIRRFGTAFRPDN